MWPLFTSAYIVGFVYVLHGKNVCRNTCNDGGCDYTDESGTYKGCDCSISNESRIGNECESYKTDCKSSNASIVCQNNGRCVQAMEFAYCDCPKSYFGMMCEHSVKTCEYTYRSLVVHAVNGGKDGQTGPLIRAVPKGSSWGIVPPLVNITVRKLDIHSPRLIMIVLFSDFRLLIQNFKPILQLRCSKQLCGPLVLFFV